MACAALWRAELFFDLLHLDSRILCLVPLTERKARPRISGAASKG